MLPFSLPPTRTSSNMPSMKQLASKALRVLSRADSERRKKNLLDLPTDLLLQIFSYIPLHSQASLTLSSKGLYQLFNHVLKSKELRFPRMPRKSQKAYWKTDQRLHRMSLLVLLQKKTWACCGRCQKLHPRSEFPWQQLMDHRAWNRACERALCWYS